ncbi:MAG: phosphatidylglycerol lysyltransferase domain-containing protein [Chlamydiales bacterium]|nr:phosphatidylglycerol lysyltransferase domain-containing protein [Chlamydiales bacterium]
MLSQCFKELGVTLSTYSFATLYLFRKKHDTCVIFTDKIYVKGKTYDEKTYLMLCYAPNTLDQQEMLSLLKKYDFIYPVPEVWRAYFDPDKFSMHFLEANSDYVFSVEKLATYPGRELSSKRNLEKQFKDHYDAKMCVLTEALATDAEKVLNHWQDETKKQEEETDYEPCREALKLLSFLELEGRIFYVGKEPIAFLIGEAIGKKTFIIHFAKADTRYKGVYPYIYQTFAEECLGKYRYFNMEEDLGLPTLIQAKRAYLPDFYNVKLRVVHSPRINSERK